MTLRRADSARESKGDGHRQHGAPEKRPTWGVVTNEHQQSYLNRPVRGSNLALFPK
jgi:hypothetical protein